MTITEHELWRNIGRRLEIADADRALKSIGGQLSGARRRQDPEEICRLERERDAARERLQHIKEIAAA